MSSSRAPCCSSGGAAADRAPAGRLRAGPLEPPRRLAPMVTPGEQPQDAADSAEDRLPEAHVVILSGLSGGGKTAAAKLFEDLNYVVVDNLPGELLGNLAELVSNDPTRFARVAIVLDVRTGDAEAAYRAMRGALEGRG